MSDLPLQDPTALAKSSQLDVIARSIVEGYMMGQHKSPFKGTSVEFVEHRQYYPGDEIRHIDWRALGKTGKYYVKEFEEETNMRVYLLLDSSGSMAYAARTLSKFAYARIVAASLGYLLHHQRDAVGLISFDTQIRQRIEPSTNPKNFQFLTSTLMECQPGGETALSSVLSGLVPTLKRRSMIVLISDFFDDPRPLEQALQMFRRHRHEVILIQVLAPEELEFPFDKPTQFRSLERTAHRLLVDPHRLRQVYLKQFREFQDQLKNAALGCGDDLLSLQTVEPFEKAVGSYLTWRTQRGKTRHISR